MAASVRKCMWLRLLEIHDQALQKNICEKAFCKKRSNFENLPMNNENLVLVNDSIFW